MIKLVSEEEGETIDRRLAKDKKNHRIHIKYILELGITILGTEGIEHFHPHHIL